MNKHLNIKEAVTKDKPELITSHPSFNLQGLLDAIEEIPHYDEGCCVDFFENSNTVKELGGYICDNFNCNDCLFDCSNSCNKITLQSVLEWLQKGINQSPITELPAEYCF